MNAFQKAISRLLRGPRISRFLERLGVDSRRYWLLMDLFGEISDRGEMMDQLGRGGVSLQLVAWFYFALSAILSVVLVVVQPALTVFSLAFLGFTAFLLLSVLLSEAANSLVNPVEAMALAHQPINGATYTAAKLSHLVRIVLYLVPGMNVVPALAGLMVPRAGWPFPFLHMAAAFVVGLVVALLCCAIFGWLIRFLPARRLKAVGQLAGTAPFLVMMSLNPLRAALAHLKIGHWIPAQPAVRWGLAASCGIAVLFAVVLGIRSLSVDYLIRVSSMVRGGADAGSKIRRSRVGAIVCRYFGGQPARAGFAFVSRMMLRDWQFRRQLLPLSICMVIGAGGMITTGWRTDPFSGRFTPMHLLPHFAGFLLFSICSLLPYSNDYKGAWVFLLAPSRAIDGFAGGAYALLWINVIVIPDLILIPLLAWPWGLWRAGLFAAYSLAVASVYLGLELPLIEAAPFSKQADASRGANMLPLMMLGGIGMAIAVGVQYFLVFRSPAIVAAATVALGAVAYFVTRRSIHAFAASIRYNLGLVSGEAAALYQEIDS